SVLWFGWKVGRETLLQLGGPQKRLGRFSLVAELGLDFARAPVGLSSLLADRQISAIVSGESLIKSQRIPQEFEILLLPLRIAGEPLLCDFQVDFVQSLQSQPQIGSDALVRRLQLCIRFLGPFLFLTNQQVAN